MVGDKMVRLTLMIRQRRNYYFSLSEEGERVEPELVECRRNFKKCASGSSKTKERNRRKIPAAVTHEKGRVKADASPSLHKNIIYICKY